MNMKRIVLTMIALCCLVVAKAQTDVPIAVLQSGNNVSVFKGAGGLAAAHAAATDGDVITLSEGSFNACDITKSIAIYGAGFESNETTGTGVTKITGISWYIGATDGSLSNIHLEGLYVELTNSTPEKRLVFRGTSIDGARLVKLYLPRVATMCTSITNMMFDQCILTNGMQGGHNSSFASELFFSNCYCGGGFNYFENTNSTIKFDYCICGQADQSNPFYYCTIPVNFTNSIFVVYSNNTGAPTGSTFKNCIATGSTSPYVFENSYNVVLSDIFDDGPNMTYSATRTFKIKQPETWIATDGSEIGIRGGNGWSKVPATPVVKNLSVTPNGAHLNVSYEAEVR